MTKILHFCVSNTSNFGDDAIIHQIQRDLVSYGADIEITTKEIAFLAKGGIFEFLLLLRNVDCVIIGGGGIISRFFWPLRRVFIKILSLLSIPVYFYGVGIGLRLGEDVFSLPVDNLSYWLNYASRIGVRDHATLIGLEHIGIEGVELIGDPVLSWTKTFNPLSNRKKVIGVNIANHGWSSESIILESVVKPMIPHLAKLQNEGFSLRYIAHHKKEREIFEYLAQSLIIEYVAPTINDIEVVYSDLHFHIAMMLHSTIFALTCNTPFINLLYDEKNKAFLKLFDIECTGVATNDIPSLNLQETIESILSLWEWKQHDMQKTRLSYVEKQRQFLNALLSKA